MFSLETLDRLFRRKSDNTLNAIFRKIIEGLKQTDSIGNPVAPDNYIFPHLDGTESSERIKNKTQYLTRIINRCMAQISEQLFRPMLLAIRSRITQNDGWYVDGSVVDGQLLLRYIILIIANIGL